MESHRAVPMRLFATWEVDRASTNSVPRLCNMTLNRLTILKPLESDLSSFVFAVKLQYPHFVKRKSNSLLIMLQRRKKYKTRPIPGFKTLAVGSVNLTQVLQSLVTRELPLYSDVDKKMPSAKLYLLNLNTQPLEQDDLKTKEQSCDYSDEEEDESTPNEDGGSDSELMIDDGQSNAVGLLPTSARTASSTEGGGGGGRNKGFKFPSSTAARFASRQKNLKQKFVALLKKFKMSEEEALDAADSDGYDQKPTQQEIEALFHELENLSDSGPDDGDADTLSVKSTPKPSLKPYFTNSTDIIADERQTMENVSEESKESADSQTGDLDTTDPEGSDVPIAGPKMSCSTPRSPGAERKESQTKFPTKEPLRPAATAPGHTTSFDKKAKISQKYARQTSADVAITDRQHVLERISHQNQKFSTSVTKIPVPQTSVKEAPPLTHRPAAEQVASMLSPEENFIPESLMLVCATDVHCQALVNSLRDKYQKLFVLTTQNDVKSFFNGLVVRIQRFFNVNSGHRPLVKIGVLGGDRFISFCLKSFVEIFQPKPNEWLHFIRHFFVTPNWSTMGRCLAAVDHNYGTTFGDVLWRDFWDKLELGVQEISDITSRISKFFANAKLNASLPIAEAMLQLKDNKGAQDEMSSQVFVPFVIDVRLGSSESTSGDTPLDSPGSVTQPLSGSPPNSSTVVPKLPDISQHGSPPGSPHIQDREKSQTSAFPNLNEAQDLQIEYWAPPSSSAAVAQGGPSPGGVFRSDSNAQKKEASSTGTGSSAGAGTKVSLKTAFRSLAIGRVPQNSLALLTDIPPSAPACMTVQFVREKKKDKMLQKLGMKNKEKIESEQKRQIVDNVSRLICSAKQHTTMKLYIDGVEWTNVKFFQTSAQWQTHVKFIPVALFSVEGA